MSRIFDHLNGEPEDRRFSRVARAMKASPMWTSVPVRDEPADVNGETSWAKRVVRDVLQALEDGVVTIEEVREQFNKARKR